MGGSGNVIWEWEGNGNEIQQSWEWELIDGNGRERESKTHSRTPLVLYGGTVYRTIFCDCSLYHSDCRPTV